jgi:hypothetical protein
MATTTRPRNRQSLYINHRVDPIEASTLTITPQMLFQSGTKVISGADICYMSISILHSCCQDKNDLITALNNFYDVVKYWNTRREISICNATWKNFIYLSIKLLLTKLENKNHIYQKWRFAIIYIILFSSELGWHSCYYDPDLRLILKILWLPGLLHTCTTDSRQNGLLRQKWFFVN